MRKALHRWRRLVLSVLLVLPVPLAAATLTVKLIAFNDFHGHLDPPQPTLGGADYLAAWIHRLEALNPRHLVIGAGDMVGASPLVSAHFHDEPTIAVLDALGLSLTSVGNHEFDHGRDELLRLQEGGCRVGDATSCVDGRFEGARFRYLAANVIDRSTGRPLFPAFAVRDFESGGRRIPIGFVGVVLRQTPDMVFRDGVATLQFVDEAAAANAAVAQLQAQGVHAVVLLIHQGVEVDEDAGDCVAPHGALLDLLPRLDPAIRLVVSGHTHRRYVCSWQGPSPRPPVVYTSAGAYGRALTEIDVDLDADRDTIVGIRARNRTVTREGAADPTVTALVARDDARVAALAQRVVGRIGGEFTRRPNAAGESTLGDLVADVQWAATRSPERGGAQIAFTNPGGLRQDWWLPTGRPRPLHFGEVFASQPFGNTPVTLTLSGRQLRAVLEQQFHPQREPRILAASAGLRYRWSASAARGHHVVANSLRLEGRPVIDSDRYRVTVNSYLAAGNDGFSVFAAGSDRLDGGLDDAEALATYVGAHSPLQPAPADRIGRSD
jgi:5'-nucleotidase